MNQSDQPQFADQTGGVIVITQDDAAGDGRHPEGGGLMTLARAGQDAHPAAHPGSWSPADVVL
jgi:hypothetical protein